MGLFMGYERLEQLLRNDLSSANRLMLGEHFHASTLGRAISHILY